jgi:hypothetical protein
MSDILDDPFRVAERYFAARRLKLSDKARRAVGMSLLMSGGISECDDSFVALTLRKTNSVLSILTDKFNLDFSQQDEEVDWHSANVTDEIIDNELKALGYHRMAIFDELGTFLKIPHRKSTEFKVKSLAHFDVRSANSEVLSLAAQKARAEQRETVQTFDLLRACAEMPLTGSILDLGRLTTTELENQIERYTAIEPAADSQRLILTIDDGKFSVRSYSMLDGIVYEDRNIGPQQLVVQLASPGAFVEASTIVQFEELINWSKVSEEDIHKFLEEHPELLIGADYKQLQSKLILERGDKGRLIPDFFAELTTSDYCDIIDLKKPNEALMSGGKDRRGLSGAVNVALSQLRTYRDFFDDDRNRREFHSRYGLNVFRPKIAVIIGRSPDPDQMPDLIRARRFFSDAEVVTYDDIIKKARRRVLTTSLSRSKPS